MLWPKNNGEIISSIAGISSNVTKCRSQILSYYLLYQKLKNQQLWVSSIISFPAIRNPTISITSQPWPIHFWIEFKTVHVQSAAQVVHSPVLAIVRAQFTQNASLSSHIAQARPTHEGPRTAKPLPIHFVHCQPFCVDKWTAPVRLVELFTTLFCSHLAIHKFFVPSQPVPGQLFWPSSQNIFINCPFDINFSVINQRDTFGWSTVVLTFSTLASRIKLWLLGIIR